MTGLEIALQRIEECHRTQSVELDLSSLGLTEIPEQIFELVWLQKLNISSDWREEIRGKIKEVPPEIQKLQHLNNISFSFTQITDLSFLKYLTNLHWLDCSENHISELSGLVYVPQLQGLNCRYNQKCDLNYLEHVPNLLKLDCSGNLLTDLRALSHIPQLNTLYCIENQINDLRDLVNVPELKILKCWQNQISDLGFLVHVSQLQTLDCILNQISDLSSLEHVPHLQKLDCRANPVSDFSPLEHVPKLHTLNCDCNENVDLSFLKHIPELRTLEISGSQIRDLNPLVNVPQLQNLKCWKSRINDLSALKYVPQLKRLNCDGNKISDLNPLEHVPQLLALNCGFNQLSDLRPLEHVPQLQTLKCGSNQIDNLGPLANVPELRILQCWQNQINDISPLHDFVVSGSLRQLMLYNNPVSGIPAELLGSSVNDDCLNNLKNYWQDLARGSERRQQLKVQFVGNGRVGKTTLAYALEHKCAPDEAFKSTHGIVIQEILQAVDDGDDAVTLQLWDFGGQEIYHATHRLFLSDDCLYLLLWAEDTEEHPDETRHPVSYWLESIHDLGKNSPVILVKNQIDLSDRLPERPVELTEDIPGVKQIRQAVKISAMKYRGMNVLRGAIQDVLAELKYRVCLELPISWLQVQKELEARKAQKTIPFAHFRQLCIKAGVSQPDWFVDYLHKTGALFYRQGAFQNQVILDQNWVIEAVYQLFDPQAFRELVEADLKGHFKGRHAEIVWPDVDEIEHEIYLDFMRNSGICYETKREDNLYNDKPFKEREFILPALLPATSHAKPIWGKQQKEDWLLEIEYPFLHRSIVERLILGLGEQYQGEPWRHGIFCETDYGQLLLECEYPNQQESNRGSLCFHLRGNQLQQLVNKLRKLVAEISPHRRYQEYLTESEKDRVLLPEFVDVDKEEHSPEDTAMSKTVKLFISYAHEDEKPYREELDKRLKAIQRQLPGLEPWHDRFLLAGEQVHDKILQQLEEADIVVLLISPDFVNSDYCFSHEMEKALKLYEQKKNIVIPVIIRHTDGWKKYEIGNLTAFPKDGKPLSKWKDSDEFWGDVQNGIHKQVENLLEL